MSLICNGNEIRQEEGLLLYNANPVKEVYCKGVQVWRSDPVLISRRVVVENGTGTVDFGADLSLNQTVLFRPESGQASAAGKYTITCKRDGNKVTVTTVPATARIVGTILAIPFAVPLGSFTTTKSGSVWSLSTPSNAHGVYAHAADITFGDTGEVSFSYDFKSAVKTCTATGNVTAMTMYFYYLSPVVQGPDILGGTAAVEALWTTAGSGGGSHTGDVKTGYIVHCEKGGTAVPNYRRWQANWAVDLTPYSSITFSVSADYAEHMSGADTYFYPTGTSNTSSKGTYHLTRNGTTSSWTVNVASLKGYYNVALSQQNSWTDHFSKTYVRFLSIKCT